MHQDDSPDSADTGEISRGQRRRAALDVLKLAQTLVELSAAQLDRLPLPDDLRDEVRRVQRVTQQIARKRETQYLAKQLRQFDEVELDPLRAALDHDREYARREMAALHRVETWRERLLADGDPALSEFVQQFPQADRQHLRHLTRQALAERKSNKPPHAYRELFRVLRDATGIGDGKEPEVGNRDSGFA
ncbi:MAG TPA: ribosome biogenesis factor YjgA [Rudaea sp.]|nr:ribosome biogenesis factor YjgA [Rudaea sp.]